MDLTLTFSSSVTEKWVLDKLKEAANNGKLGDFNVNASSIQGTQAIILHTTTLPFGMATPGPPDGKFTYLYNPNNSNITQIVFAATFFRITREIPLFSKMLWLPAFFSQFFFSLRLLRRSKFMAECSGCSRLHTERKTP